ncbi:hypothetical protein [Paragemmobacter ruber]|uniref:Uncharacterized protein n=1 Tax=Paragemmobacter ruber TaxID=1985673 RepID=A0ABW9YA73_9RHOB|nr:hypothetical protein [Rhodobacter ruber]NBE09511.1 hypothetical protein [Rhodobacter ruber]
MTDAIIVGGGALTSEPWANPACTVTPGETGGRDRSPLMLTSAGHAEPLKALNADPGHLTRAAQMPAQPLRPLHPARDLGRTAYRAAVMALRDAAVGTPWRKTIHQGDM